MKRIALDSKLSVGGQPGSSDLAELARSGVATVVNLRMDGESNQVMDPNAEGAAAKAAGLAYHHIPVSTSDLRFEQVEALRGAIASSPGPVYVHCGAGQRACALTLLAGAAGPGADLLERAQAAGFPVTDPKLAEFMKKLGH